MRFRAFSSHDARDKVYALLGLAERDPMGILEHVLRTNYTASIENTYKATVQFCVTVNHSLDILSTAGHRVDKPDWPSWIPSWDLAHPPWQHGTFKPYFSLLGPDLIQSKSPYGGAITETCYRTLTADRAAIGSQPMPYLYLHHVLKTQQAFLSQPLKGTTSNTSPTFQDLIIAIEQATNCRTLFITEEGQIGLSEGDTPLEAVLINLEAMRTRRVFNTLGDLTVPRSDKFEGHSDASVVCLARLKGLSEITSLDRARLASGCTCGQCISGFLSPRMCFALLCQVEVRHDMLSDSVGQDSGSDFVHFNEELVEYLPNRVRENLKTNKSMRQGFANMCDHIATCLRAKVVLNEANVLDALQNASEWPPVTKNFLQRGGSVASVALMLFQGAMNQDKLAGDGMHAEISVDALTSQPNGI
jgi:hypothetical protein